MNKLYLGQDFLNHKMFKKLIDYVSHTSMVPHYLRNYGLRKTLKTFYYYNFRLVKLLSLDRTKEQVMTINGYKLLVVPGDPGISSELKIFGVHEPITTKLTQQELKKGMICLDIGSNIGYYALMESKAVGNKGKVIAIEPSPKNFQQMKKNLDLEGVSNVEAYNFAAGDKDDEVNFLIHERSNLCSVIPKGEPVPKFANVITIPLKKIDSFIEEKKLEKLDFVRMDIEGYEINLFEGLWKTIRKFKPMIQMEFHDSLFNIEEKTKFFQRLKKEGYEIKYFIPRELDRPIVGEMKDLRDYKIDDLNDIFTKGLQFHGVIVFLENRFNNKQEKKQ